MTVNIRKKIKQSDLVGGVGVSIIWEINGSFLELDSDIISPSLSSCHRTLKTYWVSKGSAFSTSISKQEAELTPEMISK